MRHLLSTWPANSGKGFDQRGALDAKVAAHSRLGHAAIQRGDDGVQFLADDRRWPANYWQAPAAGGFTPGSELCVEVGSPDTRFLRLLNGGRGEHGHDGHHGRHDAPRTLVIRNADASFVFFPVQDGNIAPVPAEDSFGRPADFSNSASIRGAKQIDLVGQGAYDPYLKSGHLGILNSPQTRQATLDFLRARRD